MGKRVFQQIEFRLTERGAIGGAVSQMLIHPFHESDGEGLGGEFLTGYENEHERGHRAAEEDWGEDQGATSRDLEPQNYRVKR